MYTLSILYAMYTMRMLCLVYTLGIAEASEFGRFFEIDNEINFH